MVFTANDLQDWKDFPKGLKVLLLEGDSASAAELKAKLEAMDYNGKTFGSLSFTFLCLTSSSIWNFGLPIPT